MDKKNYVLGYPVKELKRNMVLVVPRDNLPTEEEIKELKKLGFVPRDYRALS
jgi:hypothetical protein